LDIYLTKIIKRLLEGKGLLKIARKKVIKWILRGAIVMNLIVKMRTYGSSTVSA
jgi:hypothetical protein